nr:TetR family transcriptional regulator C-terminal domain-containing protein [Kibdelosporangium aridum]
MTSSVGCHCLYWSKATRTRQTRSAGASITTDVTTSFSCIVVAQRFRERAKLLRHHISDTIHRERPDMDAGAVATELLAFLEGAVTLWLLDPGTVDLPALYRRYLDRLF